MFWKKLKLSRTKHWPWNLDPAHTHVPISVSVGGTESCNQSPVSSSLHTNWPLSGHSFPFSNVLVSWDFVFWFSFHLLDWYCSTRPGRLVLTYFYKLTQSSHPRAELPVPSMSQQPSDLWLQPWFLQGCIHLPPRPLHLADSSDWTYPNRTLSSFTVPQLSE